MLKKKKKDCWNRGKSKEGPYVEVQHCIANHFVLWESLLPFFETRFEGHSDSGKMLGKNHGLVIQVMVDASGSRMLGGGCLARSVSMACDSGSGLGVQASQRTWEPTF